MMFFTLRRDVSEVKHWVVRIYRYQKLINGIIARFAIIYINLSPSPKAKKPIVIFFYYIGNSSAFWLMIFFQLTYGNSLKFLKRWLLTIEKI